MSTATLHPLTGSRVPGPTPRGTWSPPAAGTSEAIRFLTAFSGTLLPLVAAVVALELGWSLLPVDSWPAAGAVVTGWAVAIAAWLHGRGGQARTVLAVLAAPAAVLTGPAALGWVAPAGLVLWGPVSTVLAAALVMAADPLPAHPAALP
jgi:hypothetical protein